MKIIRKPEAMTMAQEISDSEMLQMCAVLTEEGCPTVVHLLKEGDYPQARKLLVGVILKLHKRRAELAGFLAKIGPHDNC